MMTVVIGPNGSGKSAAAEDLARRSRAAAEPRGGLFYIATMVPADEDGRRRVAAHQQARSGAGFVTVESPLADCQTTHAGLVEADDVVLLEDASNLLANLIFAAHDPAATATALGRIHGLRQASRHLIVVTIGGLVAEAGFDAGTLAYIAALDELNTILAAEADDLITTTGPTGGGEP